MIKFTYDKKWLLYTDPESGKLDKAICLDKIQYMSVFYDKNSFLEDRNKTVIWYNDKTYSVINVPLDDIVNLL